MIQFFSFVPLLSPRDVQFPQKRSMMSFLTPAWRIHCLPEEIVLSDSSSPGDPGPPGSPFLRFQSFRPSESMAAWNEPRDTSPLLFQGLSPLWVFSFYPIPCIIQKLISRIHLSFLRRRDSLDLSLSTPLLFSPPDCSRDLGLTFARFFPKNLSFQCSGNVLSGGPST